ncbi:hypothetical protein CEXT_383151 [Caerostris extrusa]|uniref:Uncharacterized protein n=1 Tax=Caerostris extrusa TaxID=172846 RepID=A0AAV4NVR3_CAEEX|nr:hypothetical protein CEXT_383151 [Caerostris extrusa]
MFQKICIALKSPKLLPFKRVTTCEIQDTTAAAFFSPVHKRSRKPCCRETLQHLSGDDLCAEVEPLSRYNSLSLTTNFKTIEPHTFRNISTNSSISHIHIASKHLRRSETSKLLPFKRVPECEIQDTTAAAFFSSAHKRFQNPCYRRLQQHLSGDDLCAEFEPLSHHNSLFRRLRTLQEQHRRKIDLSFL